MKVILSKKLKEEFAVLLENHPPRQLSTYLRSLLLEYIALEIDTGLPIHIKQLLRAFNALAELLDNAADELQRQTLLTMRSPRQEKS